MWGGGGICGAARMYCDNFDDVNTCIPSVTKTSEDSVICLLIDQEV